MRPCWFAESDFAQFLYMPFKYTGVVNCHGFLVTRLEWSSDLFIAIDGVVTMLQFSWLASSRCRFVRSFSKRVLALIRLVTSLRKLCIIGSIMYGCHPSTGAVYVVYIWYIWLKVQMFNENEREQWATALGKNQTNDFTAARMTSQDICFKMRTYCYITHFNGNFGQFQLSA